MRLYVVCVFFEPVAWKSQKTSVTGARSCNRRSLYLYSTLMYLYSQQNPKKSVTLTAGQLVFLLAGSTIKIDKRILNMPPTSDAQKLAAKRYKSTDQGQQKQLEAFERWVENNPQTYQESVKKAQSKYEQKPERKAAKAEWMKQYRQRQKEEKQQAEQENQK